MKRIWVFALVLFLSSCFSLPRPWLGEDEEGNGGLDDDDVTADDDDGGGYVEIEATDPAQGETGVYYRCDITVDFAYLPQDPSITLLENGSYDNIPGETTIEGTRLTFNPYGDSVTGVLTPTTSYTATLGYGGQPALDIGFTTGPAGEDVPEHYLIEQSFYLNLSTIEFTEPSGINSLMAQYMTEINLMLHVLDVDDDGEAIDMFAFLADSNQDGFVQDPCHPTFSLTEDGHDLFVNPFFQVGPADVAEDPFPADYPALMVFLRHLILQGTFTSDATQIVGGAFSGTLDTRPMDEIIEPDAEEGTMCELLASLGIPCEACDDGSGVLCIDVAGTDLWGEVADVEGIDPATGESFSKPYEITQEMVEGWYAAGDCVEEQE